MALAAASAKPHGLALLLSWRRVRVTDMGVGLQPTSGGLGTGLSTLRERLQLTFGGDAQLRLMEAEPHGVCAELDFPARQDPP